MKQGSKQITAHQMLKLNGPAKEEMLFGRKTRLWVDIWEWADCFELD